MNVLAGFRQNSEWMFQCSLPLLLIIAKTAAVNAVIKSMKCIYDLKLIVPVYGGLGVEGQ